MAGNISARVYSKLARGNSHILEAGSRGGTLPYTHNFMHLDPLTIGGAIVVGIWIYLVLFRGRFWLVRRNFAKPNAQNLTARVVAVIPARNESAVIGESVRSLLNQAMNDLPIILVDDNSSDGTAEVARHAAEKADKIKSLTILSVSEPPSGWTGKLWAVHQGVEKASKLDPKFLLLTDADTQHAPGNVAALVAIAENGSYDLTSFMVKLHCQSFAEKLLIPAFVYFFFLLYPPAWVNDARQRIAAAAGGCMLVRPQALARIGGIEAIRGEIIDDCALAGTVKRSGGKVCLGLTETAASMRKYESFAEIRRMVSRTAFNQLRHSIVLLTATLVGMIFMYLLPVALLFFGARYFWLGAVASALMVISYWPMVRFYRLNPLWSFCLPAAAMFFVAATLDSAVRYWRGRGGTWKGRIQDPRA
jgi:hopene-associated glycosyltransferase HpnB